MKRRQVLAGTVLLPISAGCLDDTAADRDPDDTVGTDDEDRGEADGSSDDGADGSPSVTHPSARESNPPLSALEYDLDVEDATDASAAEIARIGDTSDSHWVVAMADSDDPIETTVTVTGPKDDEQTHETSVDISRTAYAAIDLRQPGSYGVGFDWDGGSETVSVAERYVDCNSSNDSVLLDPDGGAERAGETTDQACD